MQFHPTFPRKQVLVLSIAFFTCFFSLLFYSCKKNDLNQASTHNPNFTEQFFKTTSTNKDVIRIINLLKEQNSRTGFVNKLPANCGLPIWDKAVLQNKTIASRNATGDSSQDIIIPLTTNDKNISSILVAEYSSEGYLISCYTTNDYLYQSTHGNVDTTQAMKNLTLFFYMENHTFGTTTFYHIPAQLFTKSPLLDNNGDRTITIADVDTIPPAGGLMPVDWVCVEYLCPICHGADPNCPLGGSWEECTPIGGNGGGGSTGGGSTGGGSTGGTGGGGGGTGGSGGGTVCPLQGAWYSLMPVPDDCQEPPPCNANDVYNGSCISPTNYPGREFSYPYQWWKDTMWVKQNFRFGIDNSVANAPTEDLTWEEVLLTMKYPVQAFKIKSNATPAQNETITRFGKNGLNDKSDAFRHTYWLALNTKSVGSFLAYAFSNAHETETPLKFQLEKDMDLHNNNIGIGLCPQPNLTDAYLAQTAWDAVQTGKCWYLSPINYNDPCFWSCSGNGTGTHGITSQTQIKLTNQ